MLDLLTPTLVPTDNAAEAASGDKHFLPDALGGAVLVVDIHRAYREKLRTVLLSHGVTAIGTSSELRALELLSRGEIFDAVLVDGGARQAPDFDLVCQIHRQRPEIPIVVTLPNDEAAGYQRAHRSGVFRCVTRSSPADTLSDMMCEAVASSRHARMHRS